MFLSQPSAIFGKTNGEQLGLHVSDIDNWLNSEEWVAKIEGLIWSDNYPRQLIGISTEWTQKNLAGTLDARKWSNLILLVCYENQLTNINVSTNIALKILGCADNQLTELDVSANKALAEFRENPGHTQPKNLSNLKEKINTYKKEDFSCLVSGKFGNANRLKITEEGGNYIIALKRSRVPVYSNEQIYREYNRRCQEHGWKPLKSINSLTMFLNREDIMPLW